MLSSVALRAQIASVIDALSEAAVAEVARLVEDGMVVLRLQLRQRETEIHKLRSGFELLRGELRALRGGAGPGPDGGRHGNDPPHTHTHTRLTRVSSALTT